MPDWLTIVILGIIEGITEFLPISSTGHLLIAEQWLPRQSDLFNIVIQSGAVLAVLPLFRGRWEQLFLRWREPATRDFFLKIVFAFALTGVGGLVLDKKGFKLEERLAPIAWAMLIGGLLFLLVETLIRGKALQNEVTWTMAAAVGLGQLLAAVFPGTSRSGATILLMLLLGLSRPLATEFSFIVGIPTMLAAGGLKIFKSLRHPVAGAMPEQWGFVILGSVVAAVVSFVVVRWLLRYVQTHSFVPFGWYRIALGVLIFGRLVQTGTIPVPKRFVGLESLFFILSCLALALTMFWIWAVIDCALKETDEGNTKIVWMLIIIFISWIGALIYLLVRRPQRLRDLRRHGPESKSQSLGII